jgi:transposase InsO family protein
MHVGRPQGPLRETRRRFETSAQDYSQQFREKLRRIDPPQRVRAFLDHHLDHYQQANGDPAPLLDHLKYVVLHPLEALRAKSPQLAAAIDDYNREVLAIEVDTSLPALRVIRVLERIKAVRPLPKMIRVDNGPEFISAKLDHWCRVNGITLTYIQPGKPTQNAYVERLNGSMRRELLSANVFRTLDEVRQKADEWMNDYNHRRPHKWLGYRPPALIKS